MRFATVSILSFLFSMHAFGAVCDDPTRNTVICEEMSHLQAQIFVLDAQRELMQVNPAYTKAVGQTLTATARSVLRHMGPGLPEHRQALSSVASGGENLSALAEQRDPQMLVQANLLRVNCATCHQSRLNGNPSWKDLFGNDWTKIAATCATGGKNPYLCKSMYGMLSAYGYLYSGFRTNVQSLEMTAEAADEIIRILEDLKQKNFNHLPEELRQEALQAARETSQLARANNTAAFEKGYGIMNACTKCHDERNNLPPRMTTHSLTRGGVNVLPIAFIRSER